MIIEDWQQDLKRVTLRIVWIPEAAYSTGEPFGDASPSGQPQTQERVVYLHHHRGAGD
jgi:hypothetical protein